MRWMMGLFVVVLLLSACSGEQPDYQERADRIFSTFEAKITPEATNTPTRVPPPRPTPAKCEQFTQASRMLRCMATAEAAFEQYRATTEAP
jgi:hypothetical protein